MAGISINFSNMVGSKKCAVSSPRIVSLEIGDESPGGAASESAFQRFCRNDQVCRDVKNNGNIICGCDKQIDKNFIHSQSTSTCDDRPSDKIKSANDSDIDINLLDLLNSADLRSNMVTSNCKKTASDDKMKIISNVEASENLSDLLSSIAHVISEKDEGGSTFECCQSKNTQNFESDLLDFEIGKNGCVDSPSCNNSSLRVEGNPSDLLSFINIDDSDVTGVGSFNSSNMCYSKFENKSKIENEPPVTDFSDLLSSIDLGDSNHNKKVGSINHCCVSVSEVQKSKIENEPPVTDLSDLLSSIDIGDSNDNKKVGSSNHNRVSVSELKNETCLADLLSTITIEKSNEPSFVVLNQKPLNSGSLNLYSKDAKDLSDSSNVSTSDIGSDSSSCNSCASSYSEEENNSTEDTSTKNNLLKLNVIESDSGYSSVDSTSKGFSFFDYSSDNQISLNSLLTDKTVTNETVQCDDNDGESLVDWMTTVCPEFKNPVRPTSNLESSVNNDSLSMQDLLKCLNINNSCVLSDNLFDSDEKLLDCNRNVSESDLKRIDILGDHHPSDDKSMDEHVNFIDLRECIKSVEHKFTPTSPIKQHISVDNQSSECVSPNKVLFYHQDKSPDSFQNKSKLFEFNDVVPRIKTRVNTKQTLFSKALACKPKKDISLLQKVANIKNELLNNIIYRPVFIDCDVPQPVVESVLKSDRCVLSNTGRRYFGMDAPCELQ